MGNKTIILTDNNAREYLKKVRAFLASGKKTLHTPIGYSTKGYYREDSYEWIAFSWEVHQGTVTLVTKTNIQHPGECLKYLGNG